MYDAINLAYDLLVMIRGIFEFSVINMIKFMFLVFRNVLNAYKCAQSTGLCHVQVLRCRVVPMARPRTSNKIFDALEHASLCWSVCISWNCTIVVVVLLDLREECN